jgi:hypothetical protein
MHNLRYVRLVLSAFLFVGGCGSSGAQQAGAPGAREPAAPQLRDQPVKGTTKESAQPRVQPAPAESRTPEEASKRAADPKDPSGALIVEPAAPAR